MADKGGLEMGFLSFLLGFFGFGSGVVIGLVIGYYLFIYLQFDDHKVLIDFTFVSMLLFV